MSFLLDTINMKCVEEQSDRCSRKVKIVAGDIDIE